MWKRPLSYYQSADTVTNPENLRFQFIKALKSLSKLELWFFSQRRFRGYYNQKVNRDEEKQVIKHDNKNAPC